MTTSGQARPTDPAHPNAYTPLWPQIEVITEFAKNDGQTRVTSHSRYNSPEDLETVVKMGVVDGITMTVVRLEAYLRELTAQA